MKQTFTKTIQGHQLEFNKQVGSPGYKVLPKSIEFNGVLLLQKDNKGIWSVKQTMRLPAWYNEISLYVHIAIEENELKENEPVEKKNPSFNQFEYLF